MGTTARLGSVVVTSLVLACPVLAQPIYKVIDKDGKVSYSSELPAGDGKAQRLQIPSGGNAVPASKLEPRQETEYEKIIHRPPPEAVTSPEDRVRAARERVEATKNALRDAQDNPREGEWFIRRGTGGVSGNVGTFRIFTEQYRERLAALERDIEKAQEDLKKAEGASG